MRGLVVFDVDGTLTDSYVVDEEIYLLTLREAFGMENVDSDWANYEHATDLGIFEQAFESHFGQRPTAQESARFEAQLVERLHTTLKAAPERSAAIAGAEPMLEALMASSLWDLALATGAYAGSLACKLRAAGLDLLELPHASSSEGRTREQIVTLAIERASREGTQFDRVVAVGDGAWDVRTARSLALPFVGIGQGARADRLRLEGASHVLTDYRNLNAFVRALESARVPKP